MFALDGGFDDQIFGNGFEQPAANNAVIEENFTVAREDVVFTFK